MVRVASRLLAEVVERTEREGIARPALPAWVDEKRTAALQKRAPLAEKRLKANMLRVFRWVCFFYVSFVNGKNERERKYIYLRSCEAVKR